MNLRGTSSSIANKMNLKFEGLINWLSWKLQKTYDIIDKSVVTLEEKSEMVA